MQCAVGSALLVGVLCIVVVGGSSSADDGAASFQCPHGIAKCSTGTLAPLFDDDFFVKSFETKPQYRTARRADVLNLIDNITALDWAKVLETTLSRAMIEELAKYKVEPADATLDTARGLLAFPADVEFFFPEGRGSKEKRNAVIGDVGDNMGPHRRFLPAKRWIEICAKHGITLVLRDADTRIPALGQLASKLRTALGLEVGISMYYTPPGRRGVEPHIDDMDVIMVPLAGRKRWTLRPSTVMLPSDRVPVYHPVKHGVTDAATPGYFPPMEFTVERGDVLYIPRGVIHNATDETLPPRDAAATPLGSLHVSIGIEPLPRKTMQALFKAILPKVGAANLSSVRVPGVPAPCFNGYSIASLMVRRDAAKEIGWRKAVMRPQQLFESVCTDKQSPVWLWARTLKKLTTELVNQSALAAERDVERGKKVFEVLRSALGESKLRDWVDSWFDGDACDIKGTEVMRRIGDHVDKDPKGMLAQMALDIGSAARAMHDKSTAWWCKEVSRWHDRETTAEGKERDGEERYLRVNARLATRHPLAEPVVLDTATVAKPSMTTSDEL